MSKYWRSLSVIILFIHSLSQSFTTMAQQDQMYITYPFMPLNINPAYAGSREVINFTAVYRRRPLFSPLGVATTTQQYLTFDMPIAQGKMAVGFQGYNADQIIGTPTGGINGNLGLNGDLAYRFSLPNDGKLAIGLQVGVTQVPVSFVSSTGGVGTTAFNTSLGGGIYYHNDDSYLGVSFLNFNASDNYSRPIYASMGHVFTFDDDLKLKTGAVIRRVSSIYGSSTDFDLNATAWINDKYGIGVWYQGTGSELNKTAFLASFQVQLKKIQVGYSYDFAGAGSLGSVASNEGFHQLMIKYELDSGNGKSAVFKYF